jgi:hypothetical protein
MRAKMVNDDQVTEPADCQGPERVPPHATAIKGMKGERPMKEKRPTHLFHVSFILLASIGMIIFWIIGIIRLEGPACARALMMSMPEECVPEVMAWRHLSWIFSFVTILTFVLGIGHHVTGSWKSVLIDDRNKFSLSRLQLVLWSVLVLSAFSTALVWNLVQDDCVHREGDPSDLCEPLDLSIPEHLLLLMGVSSGALIGAHMVKSQQLKKKELHVHPNRDCARWTDIFETEGTDDRSWLDFGKVQMFLFTVILVLTYAAVVGSEFKESDNFAFPALPETAVVLLGISQIGYLATKAMQN